MKFYKSKTFWANVIALGALIYQLETGYIIKPEIQLAILGFINLLLRAITKEPIEWKQS